MASTSADMLEAARRYTSAGMIIHPVEKPVKDEKKTGKAPIEKKWSSRTEPRSEADLTRFWGKETDNPYNIGLLCGERSGITVLDIDDYNPAIINDLLNGIDTTTLVMSSRTPERGHFYFRYTPELKNVKKHFIGFEVLNDGSNAVLPPSNHYSGTSYKMNKVVTSLNDFPEMPVTLIKRIKELIKTSDKLEAALDKCRPCLKRRFEEHQEKKNVKDWHGATGRDITLALMSELYANGAGKDGLTLACKMLFRGEYNATITEKEINYIIDYADKGGKPWTCETIKNKCGYITINPSEPDKRLCDTCKSRGTKHVNLAHLTGNMGVFYNALADMFIEKYHPKTLDGGELRIYEDGVYPEIKNRYIINNLVLKMAAEHGVVLTPTRITTTIEMIKTKTPYVPPEEDLNKIAVSNGILDLTTLELIPHSPDIVFLNKLPVEYIPDAPEPKMFLDALSRTFEGVETQIPTLQEIFGYCLYRRYPIAAVFFLLGDGKNGKSVVLKILTAMLGDENTSGLTLSDMAQPKNEHVLMDLRGKYANICGDVGKKKIDDTAVLKMLTGRDPIRARGLFKDAITFVNYAKALFALNHLPEVNDFSDGFKRRIKIIDFPNKFDGEDEIAELDEEIIKAGELPGILNWSLRGLKRLLENNKFSNEKTVADAGLEYDMKSNPVSYFVRACIDEDQTNVERTEIVLEKYMEYREKFRLPTLSKKEFKAQLINACKDIGITTYEKRHRPSGGGNADRYYGFAGIKVNESDLKKCLSDQGEESPVKPTGQGNTAFKSEYVGEEVDKGFYRDLSTFLRKYGDEAFIDAHSAALMFCEKGMAGYKFKYGIEFIENEIKKRNDAFINFQKNAS